MNLRKAVVAAALGAAVLTSVPAVVAPHHAYADSCYDDNQTDCVDDGGDPWGDGGGGDVGGGSGGGDGSFDLSEGNVGDPIPQLPTVVVVGKRTPTPVPAAPGIPVSYGGGNGTGTPGVRVWSAGQLWEVRQNCYRNSSQSPQKISESATYTVSFETSTNISADAMEVLTASIGTKLNTSIAKTYGVEVTLNPNESWALYVEYQTVVYAVTTTHLLTPDTTEYVNVTQPTGVTTGRAC
ncbi:DUF6426 family protein [Kitasatospora sp. NPDC049285]|uniref:DUF6426 family protein n=1 Tax=Kitasatospora sp. NPDC049285 TaxID=3157096 RepID=UPI00341D3143